MFYCHQLTFRPNQPGAAHFRTNLHDGLAVYAKVRAMAVADACYKILIACCPPDPKENPESEETRQKRIQNIRRITYPYIKLADVSDLEDIYPGDTGLGTSPKDGFGGPGGSALGLQGAVVIGYGAGMTSQGSQSSHMSSGGSQSPLVTQTVQDMEATGVSPAVATAGSGGAVMTHTISSVRTSGTGGPVSASVYNVPRSVHHPQPRG